VAETTTAPGPLLVDARAAARLCGVSRSTWFTWQASGRIPGPVLSIGRLRRWSTESLRRWIERGCPSADAWDRGNGGRP
jgi:predicted DNA-binding transcriptional regulator AlpA